MIHVQCLQFRIVVSKGTGLGSAAAGSRYHVPAIRIFDTRPPGSRVCVNDSPTAQRRQINKSTAVVAPSSIGTGIVDQSGASTVFFIASRGGGVTPIYVLVLHSSSRCDSA